MSLVIEKVMAILLSIIMTFSTGIAGSQKDTGATQANDTSAVEVDSFESATAALNGEYVAADELEKDDVYPTIIIHGIGQADTYLADENGNPQHDSDGAEITGWPLYFNVKELVLKLGYPLLRTLITQKDNGLCDKLYEVVSDAFSLNAYNDDGTPKNNIVVKGYDERPISECTKEEKDDIYGSIPLQDYARQVGEKNLYYFAYNSFGDTYDIVDDLEHIIEKAKKDTGKDKVNLVPVSLGGAIAIAYLDENKTGENLNKIVFVVPALDGSEIVGKLMSGELDYSNEGLYRNMFTRLVGEDDYTGWLINIALRILPKQEVKDILSTVAFALSDAMLSKCINMWGLVPSSMYNELADKFLTDGTVLRAKADDFHEAQMNLVSNLQNCEMNGVKIYDICAYGLNLYSLIDSDSNSDKIIHSSSTSMGATFSAVDSTLGDDYEQKNYTKYDFISPDGQVDASTCAYPITTWFFGQQNHESIGHNDVVISLATTILVSKNMNVYSTQDYPQFNGHRNISDLENYLADAKKVDISTLDAKGAESLKAAIKAGEDNLAETIIVSGKTEAVSQQLYDVLVDIGVYEAPSKVVDDALLKIIRGLSEFLYKYYGPRGFTDPVTAIG